MNPFSEDSLVEKSGIDLFQGMKWSHVDCFDEIPGPTSILGRQIRADVLLLPRLREALTKLNPDVPSQVLNDAIAQLTLDRSTKSLTRANQEVYALIHDGIKVSFKDDQGTEQTVNLRVIDWDNPNDNDFLLVSQLWITGKYYTRRTDLIGYVNGIPLVLIENKSASHSVKEAFDDNIRDYKDTIPQLFWYNAMIILTNGTDSRMGSVSATWEHFSQWKKVEKEDEKPQISLEAMIRGTCDKTRLLDLIENFTLFVEVRGGIAKIVAKNHQFLGVNQAIEVFKAKPKGQGAAGVFWHTQGSGKSYSMIFYSQKIFRKLPGNWTFVVLTDRKELDKQIYQNFAGAGAVSEPEDQVHAESAEHLKKLLHEDHRYVFTLIHKFRDRDLLSDRNDIIVMADEAHRSQYDTLAMNMREGLPHASFIAFTGTPLIKGAGEEKTRETFGDYVSIYNFKQSVDDNATVPLFYENRIPELQLDEQELTDKLDELLEQEELSDEQELKLQRYFSKQYHLITRDERLERIASDIVDHIVGRGYPGKAMIVSIDKLTTYRMFEKVKKYWDAKIKDLRKELYYARDEKLETLETKINFMESTDMAVVVSQGQNEIDDARKYGIDAKPHRDRMNKEDLAEEFKDADHPLRIAFVCAMWMTGFDAQSCSTVYLDRPMKNHTLMQTIARANRVFKTKPNGIIVDYIGVFRNLQKALAIYGADQGGDGEDTPIKEKDEILAELEDRFDKLNTFCAKLGIQAAEMLGKERVELLKLVNNASEALMSSEQTRKDYLEMTQGCYQLYKAVLPDGRVAAYYDRVKLYLTIAENIQSRRPDVDITSIVRKVDGLLDDTIGTTGYSITSPQPMDLSKIDFDKLAKQFEEGRRRHAIDLLQKLLEGKVNHLFEMNRTRIDLVKKFKDMVAEYNAGSHSLEEIYQDLVTFAADLEEEEKRAVREGLSDEEELAIFDLLTKPDPKLNKQEQGDVKKVARELLQKLKDLLVLDWRAKEFARASIEVAIKDSLEHLPAIYDKKLYEEKCGAIFSHVFDGYYGDGKSVF